MTKWLIQFFFFGLITIVTTGCYYPAWEGDVAPDYDQTWVPPCPCDRVRHLPVFPEEDAADEEFKTEKEKWPLSILVDTALRNNPSTKVTWQNARAAAYTWKASQSALYPTVSATEQILFQKIHGNGASAIATSDGSAAVGTGPLAPSYTQWFINSLSMTYLLLDFGGRFASIESTRQGLIAANWTHNRNIQTVVLNVLTNYYLYLQAKALVVAKEEDVKDSTESAKAAEGRFEAGVTTILDVLLAKSNLAQALLDLEQLRGTVHTSLGRLATAIGIPASTIFEVEDLPAEKDYDGLKESIDELIAAAKYNRPDLGIAEANWKRARENIVVARSAGLPTLTFETDLQTTSNFHYKRLDSQVYDGLLTLQVPIFNGFLYVNQTCSAAATANSYYAQWKLTEEQVILDVVLSYYDFNTAVETVKFSEEYYKYTKEAYDAAYASYKSGVATILDLLAAQSSLSNARAQKIQARTNWFTSLTNVAYATGRL